MDEFLTKYDPGWHTTHVGTLVMFLAGLHFDFLVSGLKPLGLVNFNPTKLKNLA